MGFELNMDGMNEFVRNLEKQFSGKKIRVPLDGSDDEAMRSVKDQIKKLGLTPNDAEIEKYVRDARSKARQS
jgi:hypothetical protein